MRKLATAVLTAAVAGGVMSLTPAAAQTADNTAFCDQLLVVDAIFQEDEPDPAEADAALSQLESTAPPEIAPTVQTLASSIRTAAQNDSDPFEDPAFEESLLGVGDYAYSSCDWQTADVIMGEYSFSGLPKSFTTGPIAIRLTNEGAEFHELAALRIKTKDKLKQLIKLSEKKVEKKIEFVGHGFAAPGDTGYMFLDLAKSGRYGAVCFVPVGSTPEAGDDVEGPPHAHEGMYKEFKVTKA